MTALPLRVNPVSRETLPSFLARMAVRAGLEAEDLIEMISWTGKPIGDVRMEFRNEVFVSRALRNPQMRGCPVCLREDAETHPVGAAADQAMRGDWQFREVNLCVRHRHPLVDFWREQTQEKRYDTGPRLADIREKISGGEF